MGGTQSFILLTPFTNPGSSGLGLMPSLSTISTLPTFNPGLATPNGLELLATAATVLPTVAKPTPPTSKGNYNLSTPGPYNPAAALPQRMVKKILDLEFVEMAELTKDA